MSLLQVKIEDDLKMAIANKAKMYGVPISSLVKIVLVKAFVSDEKGNIFNADRDNQGKGIAIDDMINVL